MLWQILFYSLHCQVGHLFLLRVFCSCTSLIEFYDLLFLLYFSGFSRLDSNLYCDVSDIYLFIYLFIFCFRYLKVTYVRRYFTFLVSCWLWGESFSLHHYTRSPISSLYPYMVRNQMLRNGSTYKILLI